MLDLLTSSGLVRQWTLVDGAPRCIDDAIDPTNPLAAPAYGLSVAIVDLLEREAAYPPSPPIPAEGEEPAPEWMPPEIDDDVAALRRIRSGEATDEDRDLIEAFLNEADPVSPPLVVPDTISDRQFAQGLQRMGLITKDEARAFIKTGDIPPALDAFIQAIPNEQDRFDAEITIAGATMFRRQHPLVLAVAAGLGWPDAQLDAFWAMCGSFP